MDSRRPYPIPPMAKVTVSLYGGAVVVVGVVGCSVVVVTVVVAVVTCSVVVVVVAVVTVVGWMVVDDVEDESPSHELRGGLKGPETQESHSPMSSG